MSFDIPLICGWLFCSLRSCDLGAATQMSVTFVDWDLSGVALVEIVDKCYIPGPGYFFPLLAAASAEAAALFPAALLAVAVEAITAPPCVEAAAAFLIIPRRICGTLHVFWNLPTLCNNVKNCRMALLVIYTCIAQHVISSAQHHLRQDVRSPDMTPKKLHE